MRYPGTYSYLIAQSSMCLDLSRNGSAGHYVYDMISNILHSANIEYVKWDMNRSMADVYASNVTYDYVVGVYDFLEKLTSKYPNILIEGCSGGGGRFDAGMLYYTPQIWCSDNTDAINRTRIQYGTSFFYRWQLGISCICSAKSSDRKSDKPSYKRRCGNVRNLWI